MLLTSPGRDAIQPNCLRNPSPGGGLQVQDDPRKHSSSPLVELQARNQKLLRCLFGVTGVQCDRDPTFGCAGRLRKISQKNLLQVKGSLPVVREMEAEENFGLGADICFSHHLVGARNWNVVCVRAAGPESQQQQGHS